MQKKLIITISILIIIFIIIICLINNKKDPYKDYKTIGNYDDLEKINNNYVELKQKPIENQIEEKEYIKKLSYSLILGYSLYSSPFTDEEIVIKDMEELELLNLTYIFLTNNNASACIKEDFLKEMLYKYFRIKKRVFSNEVKEYLYDKKKKSYCFNSVDFDDIKLDLINYQKYDDSIQLKYIENNINEDEKYEWNIKFSYDKEGYYLRSFSNIIISN
ncbi:MAG: hypothetical protein IKQ35_00500 [Bacilli bacterium]|nr:hypothetical protein [Bacilli bacterium]